MRHFISRGLSLLAGTLLVLAAVGCQTGTVESNHKVAVDNANNRWHDMRSRLVLQMAQRQFDTGDLDQAEKSLGDALNVDGKNPALYLLAGRIAIEHGQLEKASGYLSNALELNPEYAEAHYYQGLVMQRWLRYDQALAQYRQAYELKSQDPAYLLAVAEMLVTCERVDEAQRLLTEKLSYFDQNAGVRLGLAQVYLIKKQYAQAVEYYRQAATLRPEDTRLQEDLAFALMEAQQYETAITSLRDLLNRPENDRRTDLRRMLARCYEAVERFPAAKAQYLQLTKLDPSAVEYWLELARLCWKLQDDRGTATAAQQAILLAPKRYEGYVWAALAEQKQGNLNNALARLDKAADLAPTQSQPLVLRGLALEQAGQRHEAAAAYAQALLRDPQDVQAKERLQKLEAPVTQP